MKNCYDLRLMGAIWGGIEPVDDDLLALCGSFSDALKLCIQLSKVKRTDANLALEAGIHPAQFCRIRQGKAHLPGDALPAIERLCGNTAMTQWLAKQHNARLEYLTELEMLRREVDALRRHVA